MTVMVLGDDLTGGPMPSVASPPDGAMTSTSRLAQVLSFGVIGIACTAAYLALFIVLQGHLGSQGANLVALLVTAVANTTANRRFTFGVRGSDGAARHQLQGLVVFAITLGISSGALDVLNGFVTTPSRLLEVAMLVVANLAATLIRFALLRIWVFPSERSR